ncbi:MAG: zinc-binding dehydrogenase [Promethearchaeota archaeon]
MKGLYFPEVKKVEIRDDLPKPIIEPDEVLIKVKNCGICGSDISSYLTGSGSSQRIILGHEFSGEIAEIGEKVKKWKVGDRVTANPNVPCRNCYWCDRGLENMCIFHSKGITHDGALAEYIGIRADRLHHLSDSISFETGAMIETLSNAVYATRISGFKVGDNAAVFGAGNIGLLIIQVLKAAGASNIYVVEPVKAKQQLALDFGADKIFDSKLWSKIIRLTNKMGPDYVFDCVGIPDTINASLTLVRRGGIIMVIGIYFEPFEIKGFLQFLSKNLTMKGMYLVDQDAFKTSIRLIEQDKIKLSPLITRRIKLDEAPKAFEDLSNKIHEDIKIMVQI